jgi:hypothetical protein
MVTLMVPVYGCLTKQSHVLACGKAGGELIAVNPLTISREVTLPAEADAIADSIAVMAMLLGSQRKLIP